MSTDYSGVYSDLENDAQREAWGKAREQAMEGLQFEEPTFDWDTSYIDVDVKATLEYDGVSTEVTEGFSVDLSDCGDVDDVIGDWRLQDNFDYDDIREEVAEYWADEHWTEFMPEDKRSEEEIELEEIEKKINFIDNAVNALISMKIKLEDINKEGHDMHITYYDQLSNFFLTQSGTMVWKAQSELSDQRDKLANRRHELRQIIEARQNEAKPEEAPAEQPSE